MAAAGAGAAAAAGAGAGAAAGAGANAAPPTPARLSSGEIMLFLLQSDVMSLKSRPYTNFRYFLSASANVTSLLPQYVGVDCVQRAELMLDILRQDPGLKVVADAAFVVASGIGTPDFGHAALAVSFQNPACADDAGFVVLDFDIAPVPLVCKFGCLMTTHFRDVEYGHCVSLRDSRVWLYSRRNKATATADAKAGAVASVEEAKAAADAFAKGCRYVAYYCHQPLTAADRQTIADRVVCANKPTVVGPGGQVTVLGDGKLDVGVPAPSKASIHTFVQWVQEVTQQPFQSEELDAWLTQLAARPKADAKTMQDISAAARAKTAALAPATLKLLSSLKIQKENLEHELFEAASKCANIVFDIRKRHLAKAAAKQQPSAGPVDRKQPPNP